MMMSPFRAALGSAFERLPQPIQAFHGGGAKLWAGEARVAVGPLTPVLGIAGFPRRSGVVPVTVAVTPTPSGELWERRFGTHVTRSHLTFVGEELREAFGPLVCRLALSVEDHGVDVAVTGLRAIGIPLPTWAVPRSASRISVTELGMYMFDIAAFWPGRRQLIRYTGTLQSCEDRAIPSGHATG